jgi:hypothetical protein
MVSHDLYGFVADDLAGIANRLATIMNINWTPHESSFRGGAYYRSGSPGREEFILQRNLELEGELAEPDFNKYSILLYIGWTERSEELANMLLTRMEGQVALLRHEVL